MLSRTAESLYWMGRYTERAENMARLLDVSQRIALQHAGAEQQAREWQEMLEMLGHPPELVEKFGSATPEALLRFVGLDRENPSSIYSGLRIARSNAHGLRSTISNEMWETLNTTWLTLRDLDAAEAQRRGLRAFCDWVKERSHVFRGVCYGTTLHDDTLHFLRLGTFLERADNTARLLDTKSHTVRPEDGAGLSSMYYNWGAVLRAVGAFRAYNKIYHDVITPEKVADLLVLRREMPRSLRFCADQLVDLLDQLSYDRDLECQRMAGELQAGFRFARIEKILEAGLRPYLGGVVDQLGALAHQLSMDFMMTV